MASPTTRNQLPRPEPSGDTNAWGDILNAMFELLDASLDGVLALSASTTLSTDQDRYRAINYTGVSPGTITISSREKVRFVRAATADCTITNGSNSVVVKAGGVSIVLTNGTGVWLVQDAAMASKDYVQGVAFGNVGDLPAQAGNAGKFVKTDGTSASWQALTIADMAGLQALLDTIATKEPIDRATAAQFRADSADKLLSSGNVWDAAEWVTIPFATSLTLDLSAFLNGTVTLTDNVTFNAPSSAKPGQVFNLEIVQDGTGSRVATWNSAFKFANGVDTLSTAPGSKDLLVGVVRSSGLIYCSLMVAPS